MFVRNLRVLFRGFAFRFLRQQSLGTKLRIYSNFILPKRGQFLYLWLPTITTVHAFGWSKGSSFSKADKLFDENKFEEIRQELAPFKDSDNAEALWRLARAIYKLSKEAKNENARKQLIEEGLIYAEKALASGPNIGPVHKWYSILLDAKSNIDGIKARITVTEKVKHHMMKAVELDPKDATTLYMLGLWCYEVTVLPWYQRQIASAIFATPPTSTYEEALEFCERAEKISPNFYSSNLLLIGKLYDKLGQREKAVGFLKRAETYPAKTQDDTSANKEAAEILRSWGVK